MFELNTQDRITFCLELNMENGYALVRTENSDAILCVTGNETLFQLYEQACQFVEDGELEKAEKELYRWLSNFDDDENYDDWAEDEIANICARHHMMLNTVLAEQQRRDLKNG